jgi:isocitrate/isopropylmalate dehydrogenase
MMLDYLGETASARLIESAIRALLVSRRLPGFGPDTGLTTQEVGELIASEIEQQASMS